MFVLPLIALAVGAYFWQMSPATGVVPACTWRVGRGTDIVQGANYDELPAESPIRLSVVCPKPRHVYVFSHSQEDGTVRLWDANTGMVTRVIEAHPEAAKRARASTR